MLRPRTWLKWSVPPLMVLSALWICFGFSNRAAETSFISVWQGQTFFDVGLIGKETPPEVLESVFLLRNSSTKEVVLKEVESNCSCLSYQTSQSKVAPSEVLKVHLSLRPRPENSSPKNLLQVKPNVGSVLIATDGAEPIRLQLKSRWTDRIQVIPPKLELVAAAGTIKESEILVETRCKQQLIDVDASDAITCTGIRVLSSEGELKRHAVGVRLATPSEPGFSKFGLRIKLDSGMFVLVPITCQTVATPTILNPPFLGYRRPNERFQGALTVVSPTEFNVAKLLCNGKETPFEQRSRFPGESTVLFDILSPTEAGAAHIDCTLKGKDGSECHATVVMVVSAPSS